MDRIWELLAKKLNHEISDQEIKELEELLMKHQQEFQQSEVLDAVYNLEIITEEESSMISRSEHRLRHALGQPAVNDEPVDPTAEPALSGVKHHFRRFSKIYAAAALNLAVITVLYLVAGRNDAGTFGNKINTERGAKTTVHLPDGSVVILNSGSRLSYDKDFGIKNRLISLEGEAYFDVKKNPAMPMIVSTSTVAVKVLGTTFNVKAYAEDSLVEASLFTGTIQLTTEKDPERVILLRPREKVIINQKQNQYIAPTAAKETHNETVSLQHMMFNRVDSSFDEMAWLKNKLVFRSARFQDVANELQRRFNVVIHFNDTVFQDIRITGTFSDESIYEIIPALQQTIPFHYTSSGNKIYINQ
ncbi:FecR family protein [Chitinophaga sp. 22321]|uniref:FecR domain-containing protein n=1 Tax=Chitinophaga hostae TaxID=2831022 RepID=A0ABS5J134_9BACT|nr:FecR domain-containing protein [Chitinophaga hostae]MBS0028938.1 FecR domain-containing protein [Chitinophaga hostae]